MDDANNLIHLANQMGFINKQIQNSVPNASNCLTSSAVQESHIKRDKNVVYMMEDVYGMIILLGVGIVGGITILIIECFSIKMLKGCNMENLSFATLERFRKVTITSHHMDFQSTYL